MNSRKTAIKSSTTPFHKHKLVKHLVEKWSIFLLIVSLIFILFATLYPFDFSLRFAVSLSNILNSFYHSSYLGDQIKNVILFLPFGFGLTGFLHRNKLRKIYTYAGVLAASFSLSFLVEALQVFLPSRSSTISDLVTNFIGGALGMVCFYLWKREYFSHTGVFINTKLCFSLKGLTICFIVYMTLTFLISMSLQNPTNLSFQNWDEAFPLLLGNERTGDRPWQGFISELSISDRAISDDEVKLAFVDKSLARVAGNSLLASYPLIGNGSYSDRTGHLPDLVWQGKSSAASVAGNVAVNADGWLSTATPATALTQRLRQTSQFTLSTIVATTDTTQRGPARVVSLSQDVFHRNFTLGQNGANLDFRLRTPIAGVDGCYPEVVVPDVFADKNFHHLIVTYDGSTLRFYIDRLERFYQIEMNPSITVFRYILFLVDDWSICITPFYLTCYKILYYGILFSPLGFFLGRLAIILQGKLIFHILLIGGGIVVPNLILEGILANVARREIRLDNLLLSITITTISMLLVKRWEASHLPTYRVTPT
jgi:VanZ family protein